MTSKFSLNSGEKNIKEEILAATVVGDRDIDIKSVDLLNHQLEENKVISNLQELSVQNEENIKFLQGVDFEEQKEEGTSLLLFYDFNGYRSQLSHRSNFVGRKSLNEEKMQHRLN